MRWRCARGKFGAQGSADQVSGEIGQLMKRGKGKSIGAVVEDSKVRKFKQLISAAASACVPEGNSNNMCADFAPTNILDVR